MKRTVTTCIALLALAGLTVLASGQTYTTTHDGARVVTISPSDAAVSEATPANDDHASLKTLFSNLSDYKYAPYFCCAGFVIAGPDPKFGPGPSWVALPITPKASVALVQVEAPLFNITGAVSVAVWLAADSSGVPGDTIAGPIDIDNLPPIFPCCTLSTVKFADIPLTKGTTYWIVVGTDSNSTDSNDSWQFNTTDMRAHPFAIYGSNGTWTASGGALPAIAIFGK